MFEGVISHFNSEIGSFKEGATCLLEINHEQSQRYGAEGLVGSICHK